MRRLTIHSSQQDTETGYTIAKLLTQFDDGRLVDGVYRWWSNDRVPFSDMLNDFRDLSLLTQKDVLKSEEARNADNEVFFAEYREAQKHRSQEQIAEERFEARAAHGPGVELVNVITGEKYTT